MSGLFVQKHVEALRAQGCDVRVICSQGLCDTFRQWHTLRRSGWLPDIVQLNVLQKQALLALWLKKRHRIPFVLIEHWSGYLPQVNVIRPGSLRTRLMRRLCRQAEVVMPVSQPLMDAMQQLGFTAPRWQLIDNVVDDFFFESTDRFADRIQNTDQVSKKTLLHVSCFDERAKNVMGLLRAAKMLSEKRQDWQLVLVGTGVDYAEVRAYADTLEIPGGLLRWTDELTPQEVAREMQRADALVLSSRYETYGVVLAEAAAAGLPILSTPVGIAEQLADLLVPQEVAQHKPGRFAEFIETILWNTDRVADRVQEESCLEGAKNTDRFTSAAVGRQLKDIYDSCLHRDI